MIIENFINKLYSSFVMAKAKSRIPLGISTVISTIAAGLMGSYFVLQEVPELQRLKHHYLPFLSFQEEYVLPTTEIPADLPALQKPVISNNRSTFEDRIAELIVTKSDNIGKYYPGGILLTKRQTQQGQPFGQFSSYDPDQTQNAVEQILADASLIEKRVLIYDEGEGGYVPRIGTLPSAQDIGYYIEENSIDGTLKGRVAASEQKEERKRHVAALFYTYAQELSHRGVDGVLGPVLDVVPSHKEGNMIKNSQRNFSNRHDVTREIARLYIDAMHAHGIRVVGKHFLTLGLVQEGDVHEHLVENVQTILPRLHAAQTYRVLRDDLDAVMVSHMGNPGEDGRPYSISPRAYGLLSHPSYNCGKKLPCQGINFPGLVMTDDLSMRGVLDYLATPHLTSEERVLIQGIPTPEAQAALLAFNAGAEILLATKADIDTIVDAVASRSRTNPIFNQKIEKALTSYESFVRWKYEQ